MRVAAIVCTVSFTDADRIAVAPGGWVHKAMERDSELHRFVRSRLDNDGFFHLDDPVLGAISRVIGKTVVDCYSTSSAGLYLWGI